jgi:ABC-type Fe3+-hydroxamate transport system substrate-binding protein
MIKLIGSVTGTYARAMQLIEQIAKAFLSLKHQAVKNIRQGRIPRTCYLVWRDPYMTIGGDTFIQDMLARCGFENIFDHTTRYPAIDIQQLQDADCELLLLSSEPFPFKQKHIDELQPYLPNTKIMLVDGELFSWYGSRLLHAPAYFANLLQQLC